MKKLILVVSLAGVLIVSTGCQSGPCWPFRRSAGAQPTAMQYGGAVMQTPAYIPPTASAPSCGPGCSSCPGGPIPSLSGPQILAPAPTQ